MFEFEAIQMGNYRHQCIISLLGHNSIKSILLQLIDSQQWHSSHILTSLLISSTSSHFLQIQPKCLKQQNQHRILKYNTRMTSTRARCPRGILAKQTCVTQKCNASPYMCQSNTGCPCHNAHQLCKTMQWSSVVELLTGYHDNLPQPLKAYIERVDKIYNNIIAKINTQVRVFHQFVEESLYGVEYSKIMHHLSKQDYNKITCNSLGTIISKMTQRIYAKTPNQQGCKNVDKFTINQMKNLDTQIGGLLSTIESLYKHKYKLIDFQLRELNKKISNSGTMSTAYQGPRSQSSVSLHSHKHSNSQTNSPNIMKDFPLSESIVLKRTQSVNKNYRNSTPYGTASTNFFNLQKSSAIKHTQMGSTKDTHFWNPQSPIKSDLSYPKAINSKVISNASVLNHFIVSKVKQYNLIFRASDNDYDISEFYRKMANHTFHHQNHRKANDEQNCESYTLLLLRTQFGKVVGGFTNLKWSKSSNAINSDDEQQDEKNIKKAIHYKQDIRGHSFMFSVDLNQKYQLLQPQYAIYCSSKGIGFGKSDIRIVNHAQKHAKNYIGFPNSYNNGLYLPMKKSSLSLIGSHDSVHFKIPEWEMFEVILHQNRFRDRSSASRCQIQLQKSGVSINIEQSKLKTHRKQK